MSTDQARPSTGESRALSLLKDWGPTLLFNVLLPILTYNLLDDRVGQVPALLLSGAWPLLEAIGTQVVRRAIDEFSVFSLLGIGLSVVAAVGFNSPRLLLAKESAVTGLVGLIILGSLLLPRPLMFYLGRRFATDGTAASRDWWNGLWQYPGFRRTQRTITLVWGVALVTESVARIWLSYHLSTGTLVTINSIAPLVVIGVLVAWTVTYAKRSRDRSAAARAAAAAGAGGALSTGAEGAAAALSTGAEPAV